MIDPVEQDLNRYMQQLEEIEKNDEEEQKNLEVREAQENYQVDDWLSIRGF